MLKPLSYPDILLNLPVDGTLKLFLERERLPVSDTFAWTDDTASTEELTLAIQSCPQSDVRDAITAGLHTSAQMAGPAGMLALFQVARNDGTVFAAFILCVSDMHRAFWLFVHHPKLFEEAGDIEYADQHIPHAQQHDLGVHLPVLRTDKSRDDFAAAIKQFYQQEMDRGDVCIPRLIDRAGGTQLVCVHVKDRATSSIEFEGTELRRRVGNPIIHMALEYCETTGGDRRAHDLCLRSGILAGGCGYRPVRARQQRRGLDGGCELLQGNPLACVEDRIEGLARVLGETRAAGQRFDADPVAQQEVDGGTEGHGCRGVDGADFSMGTCSREFDHGCDDALNLARAVDIHADSRCDGGLQTWSRSLEPTSPMLFLRFSERAIGTFRSKAAGTARAARSPGRQGGGPGVLDQLDSLGKRPDAARTGA